MSIFRNVKRNKLSLTWSTSKKCWPWSWILTSSRFLIFWRSTLPEYLMVTFWSLKCQNMPHKPSVHNYKLFLIVLLFLFFKCIEITMFIQRNVIFPSFPIELPSSWWRLCSVQSNAACSWELCHKGVCGVQTVKEM